MGCGPWIIVVGVANAAVLRHELFRDLGNLIVFILLVKIGKRFAEILNLEIGRNSSKIEGMDLY